MRALLIPAVALIAGGLAAQSTFVLPTGYDVNRGTTWNYYPFHGTTLTPNYMPYHTQFIYDTAAFPVPVAQLRGMAFRRPRQLGNNNPAATIDLIVDLSVGPNDAASASSTFASNLGANPMNVYKAQLNLPAEPGGGAGVAPFSIVLPFSQPFPFAVPMGLGLVVDIIADKYTATSSWYMDAVGADIGLRTTNLTQSACKFSNGQWSNSGSFPTPYIGMPAWRGSSYSNFPNMPAFDVIGTMGMNSVWGGISLPIDLTNFGAPGCRWPSDFLMAVPMNLTASGANFRASWPAPVAIPNDPVLSGADFFCTPFSLDPAANAMGFVVGWSNKFTIGSNTKPGGSIIYKMRDTTPPAATGSLLRDRVYVTEFTY